MPAALRLPSHRPRAALQPPEGRVHRVVELPADSHVHTEWSWDAPRGSMEQPCARAALGLPAIAFTEHFDLTRWMIAPELARRCRSALHGGAFERVLGSLHSVEQVVRAYLDEVLRMVQGSNAFSVLAHIDDPARGWPDDLVAVPGEATWRRRRSSFYSGENGGVSAWRCGAG